VSSRPLAVLYVRRKSTHICMRSWTKPKLMPSIVSGTQNSTGYPPNPLGQDLALYHPLPPTLTPPPVPHSPQPRPPPTHFNRPRLLHPQTRRAGYLRLEDLVAQAPWTAGCFSDSACFLASGCLLQAQELAFDLVRGAIS